MRSVLLCALQRSYSGALANANRRRICGRCCTIWTQKEQHQHAESRVCFFKDAPGYSILRHIGVDRWTAFRCVSLPGLSDQIWTFCFGVKIFKHLVWSAVFCEFPAWYWMPQCSLWIKMVSSSMALSWNANAVGKVPGSPACASSQPLQYKRNHDNNLRTVIYAHWKQKENNKSVLALESFGPLNIPRHVHHGAHLVESTIR